MNVFSEIANFLGAMDLVYQIALLAIVVVAVFAAFLWKGTWERRSHVAQVLQAIAVVVVLALAVLEYAQHYQGDKDRKKHAVIDILRATMGSQVFGRAFSVLYDQSVDKVLIMKVEEFDPAVAQLSDIFWTVGACVMAGQCDPEVARTVFCYDFKTYEFAYNVVHQQAERWQAFDDPKLDVFCQCPNEHRFSQAKLDKHPESWTSCTPRGKRGQLPRMSVR